MEDLDLTTIELDTHILECSIRGGFATEDEKSQLIKLEFDRLKILQTQDEVWQLKIRATWIKAGDENSKIFHQFSRGRKAINTIWELDNEDGTTSYTFTQLA